MSDKCNLLLSITYSLFSLKDSSTLKCSLPFGSLATFKINHGSRDGFYLFTDFSYLVLYMVTDFTRIVFAPFRRTIQNPNCSISSSYGCCFYVLAELIYLYLLYSRQIHFLYSKSSLLNLWLEYFNMILLNILLIYAYKIRYNLKN